MLLSTIENRLLTISTILADTKSHQYTPDRQTIKDIEYLGVTRESLHRKSGNKGIENNSESSTNIKPAKIEIILLSIFFCSHNALNYLYLFS